MRVRLDLSLQAFVRATPHNISSKNPRQYAKYCLRFLANLPKILTAQSAHQNHAVSP